MMIYECKACGYREGFDYNIGYNKEHIGDEKFKEINGHFTIMSDYAWGEHETRVYLFACPKCGTVIMRDL